MSDPLRISDELMKHSQIDAEGFVVQQTLRDVMTRVCGGETVAHGNTVYSPLSVEQMCRELLTKAIVENLVTLDRGMWRDPDPMARTSGELSGMANLLNEFLSDKRSRA